MWITCLTGPRGNSHYGILMLRKLTSVPGFQTVETKQIQQRYDFFCGQRVNQNRFYLKWDYSSITIQLISLPNTHTHTVTIKPCPLPLNKNIVGVNPTFEPNQHILEVVCCFKREGKKEQPRAKGDSWFIFRLISPSPPPDVGMYMVHIKGKII